MKIKFYDLPDESKKIVFKNHYRGKCIHRVSGLCGEIFVFNKGVNTFPRYSCIKLPKPIKMFLMEKQQNDLSVN